MITPIEIQNKSFKNGIGYDKKDVDHFINEILKSYEVAYRENMELNDKVATLGQGIQYYKSIEKTLQKALVLAEKTAESTRLAAMNNAKQIENEAITKAHIILADAKNELNRIHDQSILLIQQYERYKAQFKNLAKVQVELLESENFNISRAKLDSIYDTSVNVGAKMKLESKPISERDPGQMAGVVEGAEPGELEDWDYIDFESS